ncbi:uncharacterized, partial [Tachysurus ichikawai]
RSRSLLERSILLLKRLKRDSLAKRDRSN